MRNKALIATAVMLLWTGAFGQEPVLKNRPVQEPAVSDVSYARLSFIEGPIFLQRASDLGYEEATINTPIGEGDRLGATEGRAEVAFGEFRYARLDHNSKIDILTLPRGSSPLLRLRQMSGSLFLDLGRLDKEKSVELLTAQATFYFLDRGRYRIDIDENGTTEILVFSGLVEAAAEEGSIVVKEGQRLSLTGGRFNGRPASFIAVAEDAFDRWNEERAAAAPRPAAESRLPEDIAEYESELDAYGDWVDVDPFGYVWVPYSMGPDWRPYSWGRWTWMQMAGWCWVPYEPWGWSTYHYGRWHWSAVWGWYWIPLSGWGPAWVSWWWDDFYYGWAPMSWWGYPGVLYNNVYYGYGWDGDYPYNSKALTIVRKNQLQDPNVGRAALRPEEIRGLGHLKLGAHMPDVRPSLNPSLRIERLNERGQVLIRKEAAPLTREDAASSVSRDLGKTPSSSPRVIRPADQAKAGDKASTARTVDRKAEPAKPATPPAERRIRKKEGDGSMEITPFPSSNAISRESLGRNSSTSGTLLDKFYRYFQNDGSSRSSSGKSSSISGRSSTSSSSRSSSSSSRSSSSSVSRSSSSRSSGSSSSRSSGGSSRSSGSSSRSSGGGGGGRKK